MATPLIHDLPTVEVYTATAGQQDFPFSFAAFSAVSVYVQVAGVTFARVATAIGAGQYDVGLNPVAGGNVHLGAPCAGGERVIVYRVLPIERLTQFPEVGPVGFASVNREFNRLVSLIQDQSAVIKRTLRLPLGSAGLDIQPGLATAGKFFGFDTNGDFALVGGTGSATDASLVSYLVAEFDAQARPLREKLGEFVSIADFKNDNGTRPGQGGDDSSAFRKALKDGRTVYIPSGMRVKCNIVTPPSFAIRGSTSKISTVEPFDKTMPAIKVAWDNFYWSYCRSIENLQVANAVAGTPGYTSRTGFGIVMGRNGPTDFTGVGPYPQYSGGMVLRNVTFRDLRMGFRSGCGNIGVEFYTCNAASCYYGFYLGDNKNLSTTGNLSPPTGQPGDTSFTDGMHAGNKYFYGGEIDDCDVGVYIHNATEGFGAISFYGTIIEYNRIGAYIYSNNVFFPISFYDCWNEGNGQAAIGTPRPAPVVVDAWSTAGGVLTRSDRALLPRTLIVEGTRVAVNYVGGFFTDVRMTATNSRINVTDAQVEYQLGYGGSGHYVDDGSSKITFVRPKTLGGIGAFPNVLVEGAPHIEFAGHAGDPTQGYAPGQAGARHWHGAARLNKLIGGGQFATGGFEGLSIGYTRARPFTGFANITPTVGSGGRTFPLVTNFDITTTTGADFLLDANASFTTTTAGWYAFSIDMRRLDGVDIALFLGDLNTTQIVSGASTVGTEWMTICAMAYLPAGRTIFPAFQPVSVGRSAFQISAYQARRFNTRLEAETYLAGNFYAVEQDDLFMDANVSLRWRSGGLYPWRFGPNPLAGTFEWSADPATAKRMDVTGFGVRWDGTYNHEFSWANGAGKYKIGTDTVAGDFLVEQVAGGSSVFRTNCHVNLLGKELRVSGNKVVGARGATVAAAVASAAAPTKAEFDALVAVVNALRDRLRVTTGHGLIAD